VHIISRLWTRKYLIGIALLLGVWTCDSQDSQQKQHPPAQKQGSPEEAAPAVPSPRPEDWYMFMYDLAFSGQSPDKTLKPPLTLLWQFKTGAPLQASPVIVNGILYIGSTDGKLYALNAKQWEIKWIFNAGSAIRHAVAVSGGRVYFSSRDNNVYSLNAESGDVLWQFKSKSWMDAPPVIFDGRVYIGAFPSKIYLLNARTGALEAVRERTVRIRGIEYGCANGEFRPITPLYNANLWRERTAGSQSYPVIANGIVYIGARDGHIHAYDEASKTEVWAHRVRGFVDAAPAISDGMLYAASGDGTVYAFTNATVGAISESQPADTRQQGIVVHDDAPVYVNKEETSPLLHLNDGVVLPIVQTTLD